MTWRSTIMWWIAAALLGAYYVALERRPAPPTEIQMAREKVLDVYGDEVTAVTLRREGHEIRCEHKDQRWQVVKPEGAKVPPDLVSALIENLTDKQEAQRISDAPSAEDLQAFGLTESAPEVEIELSGGRKLSVKLGARNPPQTAIYAQTSVSPRVLLVGVNVQYYADLLYGAGVHATKSVATK
ncbi:MAG TPA: DUF4340 domain-containing protein [Candidatus Binatia bacterium]|nr:DUF4340 domain-containing protein [Candidatus Binatia bacterium]